MLVEFISKSLKVGYKLLLVITLMLSVSISEKQLSQVIAGARAT